MKAAIGVVALILWPIQFFGRDDMQRNPLLTRKGASLLKVAPGQAGRVRKHRNHAAAEHAMRRSRKKCGIHAPGVSHHQTAQLLQARL
jgi:hypothetical protein